MTGRFRAGAMALASVFLAGQAWATMDMQKAAKTAAVAGVENCQSCHADKMPKKEAATLNERGKWLVDQKTAKKADKVDVAWLKDYKEEKK